MGSSSLASRLSRVDRLLASTADGDHVFDAFDELGRCLELLDASDAKDRAEGLTTVARRIARLRDVEPTLARRLLRPFQKLGGQLAPPAKKKAPAPSLDPAAIRHALDAGDDGAIEDAVGTLRRHAQGSSDTAQAARALLVEATRHDRERVRFLACVVGKDALPTTALLDVARDDPVALHRANAALALAGRPKSDEVVDALFALAHGEDPAARHPAFDGVADLAFRSKPFRAHPGLPELFIEGLADAKTRWAAARILGVMRCEAAAPAIAAHVADPDEVTRGWVVDAAAKLPGPETRRALEAAHARYPDDGNVAAALARVRAAGPA